MVSGPLVLKIERGMTCFFKWIGSSNYGTVGRLDLSLRSLGQRRASQSSRSIERECVVRFWGMYERELDIGEGAKGSASLRVAWPDGGYRIAGRKNERTRVKRRERPRGENRFVRWPSVFSCCLAPPPSSRTERKLTVGGRGAWTRGKIK